MRRVAFQYFLVASQELKKVLSERLFGDGNGAGGEA